MQSAEPLKLVKYPLVALLLLAGAAVAATVSDEAPHFLLALAATAEVRLRELETRIDGQFQGYIPRTREAFTIVTAARDGGRLYTPLSAAGDGDVMVVTVGGRRHRITFDGALRDIVVRGTFDDRPWCAQIERAGLGWHITHDGVVESVRVLAPRDAELLALIPVKPPPDLSKFLLSPMPGLLVDIPVLSGQTVKAGERLAVIQAMKMENILFAQQDQVVGEIAAKKGDSLAFGQVIMEFT